jgi:hypothetical protein
MSHVKAIAVLLSCSAGVVGFTRVAAAGYSETNLVSDGFVPAPNIDPQLINPWGISFPPGGPFWVSDGAANTLFFSSGINAEQDGLFGSIQATAAVPLPNAAYTGFIGLAALTVIAGARRRFRAS